MKNCWVCEKETDYLTIPKQEGVEEELRFCEVHEEEGAIELFKLWGFKVHPEQ